jgi:hypothetical protein
MINHKEPRRADKKDIVTFDIRAIEKPSGTHIAFISQGDYKMGTEFAYAYSDKLSPL